MSQDIRQFKRFDLVRKNASGVARDEPVSSYSTAPKITVVLPAADTHPAIWNYTTTKPAGDWMGSDFNDSFWKQGESGFGTAGTPGAIVGTTWQTEDIWLRREVDLPAENYEDVNAWLHHDEDVEVYIKGVLAFKASIVTILRE